ncbi:hypothetical protein FBY13_107165 [Pantoea sp. SJZ147]|nr:hypothetical protein FBY13_107165 [Pantoea sp. SJZ147]
MHTQLRFRDTGIENPRVPGSIPGSGTTNLKPSLRRGFLRFGAFKAAPQWVSKLDLGDGKVLISRFGVIVEISTKGCTEQASGDSTDEQCPDRQEQQAGSG